MGPGGVVDIRDLTGTVVGHAIYEVIDGKTIIYPIYNEEQAGG